MGLWKFAFKIFCLACVVACGGSEEGAVEAASEAASAAVEAASEEAGDAVEAASDAAEYMDQSMNTPECVVDRTCTIVEVLYGTSRLIDYSEPAKQDGEFVDNDVTPFLDEHDVGKTEASLGLVVVTVPKKARPDDNKLFRPSEPNWIQKVLNLGEPLDGTEHYIFRGYNGLSKEEFANELSETTRAFVYIHGYQESLMSAAFRAAQIKVVGEFEGQAIIFSWPSFKGLSKRNYLNARKEALRSGEKLKMFLRTVSEEIEADELHIIAHSMGNYALLNALDDLVLEGNVSRVPLFDQVIMAAPDISGLEYQLLIEDIRSLADGATLYASRNDVAMRASRAACKARRNELENKSANLITQDELDELSTILVCDNRAGYVPPPSDDIPVLAKGVDAIDASNVDKNNWWNGIAGLHGYAFLDPKVFLDIGAVMDSERRSPIGERDYLTCFNENNTPCADNEVSKTRRFWRFE